MDSKGLLHFLMICAIIHVFKENKCDASAFEQKLHSTKYMVKVSQKVHML